MTAPTTHPARRPILRLACLLLLAAIPVLAAPAERAAAADPGVVEVFDYNWMTGAPIAVDLRSLSGGKGTADGEEFTAGQILRAAAGRSSGRLVVDDLEKVELDLPGGAKRVTFSRQQIQDDSASQPRFYLAEDGTVAVKRPGSPTLHEYTLNPRLVVPKSDDEMKVTISPRDKTVASGTTITFSAKVQGAPKGGSLSFSWLVGGKVRTTSTGTLKHTFKGDRGDSFAVALTVSAPGVDDATGGTQVFIGKSDKPKKKEKDEPKETDRGDSNDDDPYYEDPGYGSGYGDGSGNDSGSGTPGTGSPATPDRPEEKRKPEPPVDDGLETVRGELLDPSTSVQVIDPSSEQPPASAQPAAPEEGDSGGFGLSGGAKTAIGIAFLLGLGGLTETRSFSGLRRFLP